MAEPHNLRFRQFQLIFALKGKQTNKQKLNIGPVLDY